MRSFGIKSFDLEPLRGRGRPYFAYAGQAVTRLDALVRRYPALSRAVDIVQAVWTRLVEEICGVLDPVLARVLPDVRLVAASTPAGLELHRVEKGDVRRLGAPAALDEAARAALLAPRPRAIELRLRPDQVLRRTLSLPNASRDYLQPIIEHRLEQLTPWRPEDVLYGYRILAAPQAAGSVTIELAAASKARVAEIAATLEAIGLAPTAVGIGEDDLAAPLAIAIRRGSAPTAIADARRLVSRIALVTFAVLGLAYLGTGWLAADALDGQEAAQARLVKARRLLRVATLGDVTGPEKAMLLDKQPSDSVAVLLERLAVAIPEDTYLRELAVAPGKLRLAGTSGSAAALVGRLEAIGLTDVRFGAALVRGADGRDTFEMTADRPAGGEIGPR